MNLIPIKDVLKLKELGIEAVIVGDKIHYVAITKEGLKRLEEIENERT